jgi:serine/threonine protein kinase
LAVLGEGGMGQVFLAAGPDGRLVALKLVHPALAADAEFRAFTAGKWPLPAPCPAPVPMWSAPWRCLNRRSNLCSLYEAMTLVTPSRRAAGG